MSRKFDRADYDSRALKACYGDLAARLAEAAATLRSEVHARHYPQFGTVSGLRRRDIIRRLREWDALFRDYAERLFRFSAEIEQRLVYSIATDGRPDHRELFGTVRRRKEEADQLFRALSWKSHRFQITEELDTEAVHDFCMLGESTALFLQFVAVTLFLPRGERGQAARDPIFVERDWEAFERLGRELPGVIRSELADFVEVAEAEVVQPERSARPGRPFRRRGRDEPEAPDGSPGEPSGRGEGRPAARERAARLRNMQRRP